MISLSQTEAEFSYAAIAVMDKMQECRTNHDWISAFPLVEAKNNILEARHYDFDVWMLWYSAPTSLNNDFLNDGVILTTCNETIKLAIKAFFTLP